MKKNVINKIITAATVLTATFSLAACGQDTAPATVANAQVDEGTPAVEATTTIKVGANITPHAEILEEAKPLLAEKGINLEIVQLEDSITPNTGVIEGSLDANDFQHVPYLEQFNAENGSDLVSIGAIHY